ncbi:hypothetical protein PHLGIDRAFT_355217 [Phlebiopsis gigantea 11061_1 CR5-6]|uniref:Uncharacterized protein n=1 Tax=Phlebiopsis gigantea (strain 11061_1 CR5-6) TaxID=745531 RepID=A0A0C3SA75_PHLG1|nr:hypothetical protein PHLGIDRAFT_355217 [Phlebiopsis gigantea 11061_1 CR5-6]
MPTILHTTVVREPCEGFTLSVKAHHTLIADEPSADIIRAKGRLPGIDIVSRGDVVLAFAGISNGRPISTDELFRSTPLIHFHSYLRANERTLGVSTVSDAYIDEDDHTPKVSLSPFNSHETERLFPKVHLVAVKITLIYYTTEGQCLDAPNIFSERPFLPFTTALDSVVEKTVTFHLVRRYPLIFGLLSQKLHAEKAYCPHISRSLSCVVARSSNLQFKQDASELLRRLKKRLQSEATRITSAYERHLGIDEGQGTNLCQPIETSQTSEENILNTALSRLMRSHVRAPPFKGVFMNSLNATKLDIADEFALGNLHEPFSVLESTSAPQIKWEDLPPSSTSRFEEDDGENPLTLYNDSDFDSDDDVYSWDLASGYPDTGEDDDDFYAGYLEGGIDEENLRQPFNFSYGDDPALDSIEVDSLNDGYDVAHRPPSPSESPESSQEDSLGTPYSSQTDYPRIYELPEDVDDTLWLSGDPNDTYPNDACLLDPEPSAFVCRDDCLEIYVQEGSDSPLATTPADILPDNLEPLDCLYDLFDDHAGSFEDDSSDRCLSLEEDDDKRSSMYACDDL